MPQSRPGVLPLRPLTFGELLDAAVSLLRGHARVYLAVAVVLAAAEQAVLYPLRVAAAVRPPVGLPYEDRLGEFWLLVGVGFGTEAMIIALLGGLTARAAGPELLGRRVSGRSLLSPVGGRLPSVAAVAVTVGVLVAVAALAGLVPWIFAYGLLGLAAPAVVVDRLGPPRALLRSLVLAGRAAMRASWVRLGGYLGWAAIRVALLGGGVSLANLVLDAPTARAWAATAVAVGVNAVAYTTLACLDSVLHLETRMRTEGLDITLGRALRRGAPVDLAVPR